MVGVEQAKVVILLLDGHQVDELPPLQGLGPGKVCSSGQFENCWTLLSLNIIIYIIKYLSIILTLKSIK